MDTAIPNTATNTSLRAKLRPLVPSLVAGLLAGVVWGGVWPLLDQSGALEVYDWQAWFAGAVAFLFISAALGDLIGGLITPDKPERMDEDDLYEFREQAGIRRAFAFVWASVGIVLVTSLAFSVEYGMGNKAGVAVLNAVVLNAAFAVAYLQRKLDEYWRAEHAKTLQLAFVLLVFALTYWAALGNAGYGVSPKPVGIMAALGASYLIAWAAMAWHRNRAEVEGYAPGR